MVAQAFAVLFLALSAKTVIAHTLPQDAMNMLMNMPQNMEPQPGYDYGVKIMHTGDIKNALEQRRINQVMLGYSQVEPDGSLRTVYYMAGKNGLETQVHRVPPQTQMPQTQMPMQMMPMQMMSMQKMPMQKMPMQMMPMQMMTMQMPMQMPMQMMPMQRMPMQMMPTPMMPKTM